MTLQFGILRLAGSGSVVSCSIGWGLAGLGRPQLQLLLCSTGSLLLQQVSLAQASEREVGTFS